METAVSTPAVKNGAGGERSNGVRPSLSSASTSVLLLCCPPMSKPTRLHDLAHVRRTVLPGRNLVSLRLCLRCPDLDLRQCLVVQLHLPTAAATWVTAVPRDPRTSGPCLTLGL